MKEKSKPNPVTHLSVYSSPANKNNLKSLSGFWASGVIISEKPDSWVTREHKNRRRLHTESTPVNLKWTQTKKTWHILCRNAAVREPQRALGGGGVDWKVWERGGGVRSGTAVVDLPNSLWSFLRLCALIFRNYTWLNPVLLRDSDVFQTIILNPSDWVGSRPFILFIYFGDWEA